MYKIDRDKISKAYELARSAFLAYGIDTDAAIQKVSTIPVSLHCWQGDDVNGFEDVGNIHSENVVTGNYPGAARNGNELRLDIDTAFCMSPCKHRVNLHSIYAEPKSSKKQRDEYTAEDFEKWISWAVGNGYGLDFNPTFFKHPMMVGGFSLSSRDKNVRDYWVKVGKNSRAIAEAMGKATGTPCWNNIWIPDGLKDQPANRKLYRKLLSDSLDRIFEDQYDERYIADVLEGKLFGIGTECFTVGSHEFYLGYAATHGVGVTMDTGHYHPTETAIDKLSSVLPFVKNVMLHVSRGVRWDSDHVLIQGDDLNGLMSELKRGNYFGQVAIGLDYFDAQINRVAAWIIGLRAAGKAMLSALCEPSHLLEEAEANDDFTTRLALFDEFKNLPINPVWDMLCVRRGVPVGAEWIELLKDFEQKVQSNRK